MPMSMTKGRTIMQKDKEKGKVTSNHRPVTCLPLVCKLLPGVIAEVYGFLDANFLLPQDKKDAGEQIKSRGTNSLMFIDQMILREVNMRKQNLSVTCIDYRKAYDMVGKEFSKVTPCHYFYLLWVCYHLYIS